MKSRSLSAGRHPLTRIAAAVALCLAASSASALGLGRLVVRSALGEALRAEIDVTQISADEAGSLSVRVAPPEAYRAAGVDYNAVLQGAQAVLQRRADGRIVLRITSNRPVREPFVDVILEATWSGGRLVREYTLLLDPPSPRAPSASNVPPTDTDATTLQATSPLLSAAQGTPSVLPPPAERPVRRRVPAAAPAVVAAPVARAAVARPPASPLPPADGAGAYRVRRGDTLTGVASRLPRPPGVSLDQLLAALHRDNPQAFIGNDINRLRAGAVLAVPPGSAVALAPAPPAAGDATRAPLRAQSTDFDAYRQRLGDAAPPAAEGSSRQAAGSVPATADDRRPPVGAGNDRLTLGPPGGTVSAPTGSTAASGAGDVLSPGTTAGTAPGAMPPPLPLPPVAGPASQALPGGAVPTPALAPPSVVASAPSAPTVPPVAAPAPLPVPMPERDGESFLDDNLATLGLGALLLALLGGWGYYRWRQRARRDSRETAFAESRLTSESFFSGSGGQRIDTRDSGGPSSSTMSYSLSQLDAIGDVDPVAEADVYLAYGRDLQAEEILKEAMRANPERLAIRSKLLEVYAKRRDTRGYELLAVQLYGLTRGEGEEWKQAQALGLQIDADNPLYQPGGKPVVPEGASPLGSEPLGASTLPQSVMPQQFAEAPRADAPVRPGMVDLDLDFDLDLDMTPPAKATAPTFSLTPPAAPAEPDFTQPMGVSGGATPPALADFDLPFDTLPAPAARAVPAAAPTADAASPPLPGLDFDLTLDFDELAADTAPDTKRSGMSADFEAFADPADGFTTVRGDAERLDQKLELADEFRQIGDVDGARDLLLEVVAQADGAQRARAQRMLDELL